MLELTPERRQALDKQSGAPVRILDPVTHDAYLLVREEVFERMAGVRPTPEHEPPANIDPRMLRSMQAFWRDLPGLLRDRRHKGKWAAYCGDEQITIGKGQVETYQECLRKGMQRGEFYVGLIEPARNGIPRGARSRPMARSGRSLSRERKPWPIPYAVSEKCPEKSNLTPTQPRSRPPDSWIS
jgi:hypothetical protein